ncbi:hypothetical protein [Luteimonas aquatica]|uniref:hypothetical protein n=1 Tax=Luteimonas aquatica TaxID=450364 RepID=UPI001F59EE3C|nr:hypothetical protein [Luteimonas aquatica]
MSGISSPTDPRLLVPGLDPAQGQVALEQPQQAGALRDPGLLAPVGPQHDTGEGILQARAWDEDGPHQLDGEPELQAQFSALPLPEAAAQAPDVIAAPLEQPAADAA